MTTTTQLYGSAKQTHSHTQLHMGSSAKLGDLGNYVEKRCVLKRYYWCKHNEG